MLRASGCRCVFKLPFGEDIGAGTGGRTTAQGYSQFDGVRMKFTGAERDDETILDFMQARYYSSSQGRFTSVDPLLASGVAVNPKTWNRYAYALNNPLRFNDPTGLLTNNPQKQVESAPSCWPNCSLAPGQSHILAPESITVTATLDALVTTDTLIMTAIPGFPPGGSSPIEESLSGLPSLWETAAWASSAFKEVAYGVAPDFVELEGVFPLLGGFNLSFSKDGVLYGGYNVQPGTTGDISTAIEQIGKLSPKLSYQLGVGYFTDRGMTPVDRDRAISGTDLNITAGPITGVFSQTGGPPALVVGIPVGGIGANVSQTWRIAPR